MTSTTEHHAAHGDAPGPSEVTATIRPAGQPRHHAEPILSRTGVGAPPHPSAPFPAWSAAAASRGGTPWPGHAGSPVGAPAVPPAGPWPAAGPPFGPGAMPAGFGGAPARRAPMRWGWIVIGVVAAVLAVTLVGSFVAAQRTMTVQGTVTLHVTWSTVTSGMSCDGTGAFSWIGPGTSVTISDAKGAIVGTTTLSSGTAYTSGSSSYGAYADTCVLPFRLTDVPAGDDFYRVGVGNVGSDGVTFSADQLRTTGATISYGS